MEFFSRAVEDRYEVVKRSDGTLVASFKAENPIQIFRLDEGRLAFLRSLDFKDTDIVVATFPKCGTTVLEQIIILLMNNGDESVLSPAGKNTWRSEARVGKVWPEIHVRTDEEMEAGGFRRPSQLPRDGNAEIDEIDLNLSKEEFQNLPTPRRLIKSHFNGKEVFKIFPKLKNSKAKIVTVLRNPLDACVSAWHHLSFSPMTQSITFEQFAALQLSGHCWTIAGQPWGRLSDAEATFQQLEAQDSERTLVLSYGQLVQQPKANVEKIARHLGLWFDDELNSKVVKLSSFHSMKKMSGDASHMRQGQPGDAQNYFDEKLASAFMAEHNRQVQELLSLSKF